MVLSALLLATAAPVRVAQADQNGTDGQEETGMSTADILQSACTGGVESGMTAAYAAEAMRYASGLICVTSHDGSLSKTQFLSASLDAANRTVKSALNLDTADFEESIQPFDAAVYDSYARHAADFEALAQRMNAAVQSASGDCMRLLSRNLREAGVALLSGGRPQISLTWRECAALYCAFGGELDKIVASADELSAEGGVSSGITPVWANPSFETIASGGTREQLFEAKFALAYLKTVYNDDGSRAADETYLYDENYLKTVAHPLPGGKIKDSWYAPRSHNTRLHTGTDIHASAKTPILSATDGTVLYVGYMPIPGNFVIILDPYGYEYHYYHMYEISTFVTEGESVTQGQQIGRVGCTGNSDVFHLHISVVSPEGKYLNPYDLFAQAGIGPFETD